LPAEERARRHTARADHLTQTEEPGAELGAIPYHREHGADPADVVIDAFTSAVETCFARGYYYAVLDLAPRGQARFGEKRDKRYWSLANKIGASLSYLRPHESAPHFERMRAESTDPVVHLNTAYMMAMLYTRHLPKPEHDNELALAWVNTAIAIADQQPDPELRAFYQAFMRNARALVELHRGNLEGAMALVNEAIAITDGVLNPGQHRLHRSVLLHNRAQVHAALGQLDLALRDFDEVIERDPEYGEYYFERAGTRRIAGLIQLALDDYGDAIKLCPPFREAHFNRADLLREIGDDDAAMTDLDYGLMLDPDHVDGLINRVDILLDRGDYERAKADIAHGLELDPTNAHLLTANGSLLAELGDTDGAHRNFSAALAAHAAFVPAWTNRAVLAYATGRPADAVADLSHAISLEDDPVLRMNRAIALQDLGQHQRALTDLDVALSELGQQEPELLYRRGVSRLNLGDVDAARTDWMTHLQAYPPDSPSPFIDEIGRTMAADPRFGQTRALPVAQEVKPDATDLATLDGAKVTLSAAVSS
jgi:tetratricopeptide (TPR) repeat protein